MTTARQARTQRHPLRTTVTAMIAMLVFALAGCGSGDGDGEKSDGPKPTEETTEVTADLSGLVDPCSLITEADATALFGIPAKRNLEPVPELQGKLCVWDGSANGVYYILHTILFPEAQDFENQFLPPFEEIPGLGDRAAMTRKPGLGGVAVMVVKDDKTLIMRYTEAGGGGTTEHPEQLAKADQVLEIARRITPQI